MSAAAPAGGEKDEGGAPEDAAPCRSRDAAAYSRDAAA
jgi:hypothetical protein